MAHVDSTKYYAISIYTKYDSLALMPARGPGRASDGFSLFAEMGLLYPFL